jgi:CheY-like chemotaxis protein
MGGKLNAQSQLAHGARFEFSVLSNEIYTEPDVCIKRDCEIYSGPQRTILVVDDDAGSIAVITVLLRSHGFMTLSCDSGQKALGLLRQVTSIDLVLTDQFMEDGDGWYILRAVAEQRPEMPMVLMSTALPQRPVGFPANLDFSAFIMKPLEHQSLLRLLGRLLSVDWESAEPGRSDGETGFADLDFPDEAALNDLRWMIQNGAVSDMMDWAENLKASNPRLEAFASKVSAAARTLDFSVLHDLAGDHTGRRVM